MNQFRMLVLGALLAGAVSMASADVAVGVSVRSREKPEYRGAYSYSSMPTHPHAAYNYPAYRHHHRSHHHRHHRHYAREYRPVYVAPIVYSQPVYIQQPSTPSDVNYAADIATLRDRMARLRSITENQYNNSQIDKTEYDRFMQTLDGIDRDQKQRAFNRGGNMASYDFDELNRRLDQLDEDIEIALAS
jgi:hypothetical protein